MYSESPLDYNRYRKSVEVLIEQLYQRFKEVVKGIHELENSHTIIKRMNSNDDGNGFPT